ncbi:response regulator [Cohnella faecalis]|uniref:response regulator n=1 Tax=Cohnella faecalis TaxID=2315694 RepID=UPI003609B882
MVKAKILVVDDAAFMRMVLREMLVSDGFEVVAEGGNGAEAVQLYKQLKPDLVTMDITMPEMDGIAALIEIKKFDPQARVVMCSAMGQKGLVIDAIKAGASDFVVKPLQKERVCEAIGKALR